MIFLDCSRKLPTFVRSKENNEVFYFLSHTKISINGLRIDNQAYQCVESHIWQAYETELLSDNEI